MAVYTCTLNLAIDLFIETDQLNPFVVNRTNQDDIQANGKGVNVSMILKMLGIESTAMGIKAGFTGQYIEDFLKERSIKTDFLEVPGMTRINVFTQVKKEKAEYSAYLNNNPELTLDLSEQLETLK